jgi:isocitrate/isopropylmalate dehydrogenase
MAKWWPFKAKPKEVWDEEINWPIGDIEAADRIRRICRSVADSAEALGRSAEGGQGNERPRQTARKRSEAERYERAARTAMEMAMKIADDLMRDAAVRDIVDLCLKANDLKTARALFRAIQADTIRQDVLNDHAVLRE